LRCNYTSRDSKLELSNTRTIDCNLLTVLAVAGSFQEGVLHGQILHGVPIRHWLFGYCLQ